MTFGKTILYACATLALVGVQGAFGTTASAAALWDEIKERGTVRIGMIPQRSCYYWRNSDNEDWKGFPVRMSNAAAEALGKEMGRELKVEWVPTSWTNVILDMQSGKVDAFFGIGITDERKKAVDMFGPIYAVPSVLVVRKDSTIGNTWDDLNKPEIRITTSMGSTEEAVAKQNAPKAQLRLMQNGELALLDVQSGNADVQLETAITGLAGATKAGNLKLLLLDPYTALGSGGALRKDGDGRLVDFMQKWGDEYRNSGALQTSVVESLKECGLDVNMLPEGTKF
ncbi:MAG: transporter substrate-binding domain-containing protein [Rhizobiaceae bacterium]